LVHHPAEKNWVVVYIELIVIRKCPFSLFGKEKKMPVSVFLTLVVGISVAVYFLIGPLQVFSSKQWLISHSFMLVGLGLILGWLWFNRDQFEQITMLMGGIWTVAGGLCFVMGYAVRRRIKG
jgi:uncharacterized membrane protein YphA (DoxX/SURF4 family)